MSKSLRATLSEILAIALIDVFPDVLLGNAEITETQFSYRFLFEGPLHPELLDLASEKMRALLKASPVIEEIEMAKGNAESYFEHQGQPFKADAIFEWEEALVPMVRIGQFYDLRLFPLEQENLSSCAFQLLEAKHISIEGRPWIEIIGAVFSSKDQLKEFVKKRKQWLKDKPWEEAERKGLLIQEGSHRVLLPKGVALFHRLEEFWRQAIKSRYIEVAGAGCQRKALVQHLNSPVAEWAVTDQETPNEYLDLCTALPGSSGLIQECISSLHFISETFKMLELSAEWIVYSIPPGNAQIKRWNHQVKALKKAFDECQISYSLELCSGRQSAPLAELRIVDTLGEKWAGPFLRISGDDVEIAVEYSLFGPIKRLVALLAEHKIGKWLQ